MSHGTRWSLERKFIIERRPIPMGTAAVAARRAGRPRKQNVIRDASGKSRGEIVDFSVVLNQPHRRGVSAKHAKSELLGYALGRLRFYDKISEDQLRAGNEWALLVRAFAADQGIPVGSPRSGSMVTDSHGPAYSFSLDEATHTAERAQNRSVSLCGRYSECFEAMALLGRTLGVGRNILTVMRDVCIQDRDPQEWQIGDLRSGLNAMARIFKIG
jgi:hypothetical protein